MILYLRFWSQDGSTEGKNIRKLNENYRKSSLIEQIFVKKKALQKILNHFSTQEIQADSPKGMMLFFIKQIRLETSSEDVIDSEFRENFSIFKTEHLSCLKPTMGHEFLHHIMLSMEEFESEIDITLTNFYIFHNNLYFQWFPILIHLSFDWVSSMFSFSVKRLLSSSIWT